MTDRQTGPQREWTKVINIKRNIIVFCVMILLFDTTNRNWKIPVLLASSRYVYIYECNMYNSQLCQDNKMPWGLLLQFLFSTGTNQPTNESKQQEIKISWYVMFFFIETNLLYSGTALRCHRSFFFGSRTRKGGDFWRWQNRKLLENIIRENKCLPSPFLLFVF